MVVSGPLMDYLIIIFLIVFISIFIMESIYLWCIFSPFLCTTLLLYYCINHMRFQIWMLRVSIRLVPFSPYFFHRVIGVLIISIICSQPPPPHHHPMKVYRTFWSCYVIIFSTCWVNYLMWLRGTIIRVFGIFTKLLVKY